jgi:NADH-quinone oxidoreductase subunit E
MAVRRLHSDQPSSFAFSAENLAWAEATIARYPEGRQASAVIPLLWRAQEQIGGWITEPAIRRVADMLGMAHIRVYEIATFYTMFQLSPVGKKAHVQVCGTTPCMLRGSRALIETCRDRIAGHPHELSKDGSFSWEEVECLGSCANAPLVQIGKDTFEDLTPEALEKILDAFSRGKQPLPGSQAGRKASCPKGGATTLKDAALYDGSRSRDWRTRFPELAGSAPGGSLASAGVMTAAPQAPAKSAINPAAQAAMANAGLVPELEKRGTGRPLPQGEIEKLKPEGIRSAIGSGLVASAVVLGREQAGDVEKPELLNAPQGARRDDLKLIWGVGPKLEEALNALGIYHYSQIAAWTERNLKWVDENLEDFRGRAVRDKWIEQARKLASGWRPDGGSGNKPKV